MAETESQLAGAQKAALALGHQTRRPFLGAALRCLACGCSGSLTPSPPNSFSGVASVAARPGRRRSRR